MKFYLYRHIRHDKNQIFYVGIGTKSKQDVRCNSFYRAYAKHIDNDIWMKIVAKTTWHFEILHESSIREEVGMMETQLIEQYGRIFNNTGILANFTLGAEKHNVGYKHTEETKKKISDQQKGKPGRRLGAKLTDEQRKKASEVQIEVANRPEMLELRRNIALGNQYHLGKKHSDESKEQMRQSALLRGLNCKTVKCKVVRLSDNYIWETDSIMEMSRIVPIPISTIMGARARGYVGRRTSKKYQIYFYE
jgi:hypothetical protein